LELSLLQSFQKLTVARVENEIPIVRRRQLVVIDTLANNVRINDFASDYIRLDHGVLIRVSNGMVTT